MLIYTWQ